METGQISFAAFQRAVQDLDNLVRLAGFRVKSVIIIRTFQDDDVFRIIFVEILEETHLSFGYGQEASLTSGCRSAFIQDSAVRVLLVDEIDQSFLGREDKYITGKQGCLWLPDFVF